MLERAFVVNLSTSTTLLTPSTFSFVFVEAYTVFAVNAVALAVSPELLTERVFEPSLAEYMEGKQNVLDIIKRHSPKVLFFVYKPILENIVPLFIKVEYGFNDTLSDYFYGSRPFLFPMPGTGKVTTEIIRKSMMELKDYLKK